MVLPDVCRQRQGEDPPCFWRLLMLGAPDLHRGESVVCWGAGLGLPSKTGIQFAKIRFGT